MAARKKVTPIRGPRIISEILDRGGLSRTVQLYEQGLSGQRLLDRLKQIYPDARTQSLQGVMDRAKDAREAARLSERENPDVRRVKQTAPDTGDQPARFKLTYRIEAQRLNGEQPFTVTVKMFSDVLDDPAGRLSRAEALALVQLENLTTESQRRNDEGFEVLGGHLSFIET